VCSFSKEGEQEDVSLCGFAFANGEVCEEQSFASSMSLSTKMSRYLSRLTHLSRRFSLCDRSNTIRIQQKTNWWKRVRVERTGDTRGAARRFLKITMYVLIGYENFSASSVSRHCFGAGACDFLKDYLGSVATENLERSDICAHQSRRPHVHCGKHPNLILIKAAE
jgi:hypothetical protein